MFPLFITIEKYLELFAFKRWKITPALVPVPQEDAVMWPPFPTETEM